MPTLQAMAINVRGNRLVDPLPNRPSMRHTFRSVCDAAQIAVNRSSATGKSWSVQDVDLQVSSGAGTYTLPTDSSYGKPLSVLTVYSQNQAYINHYVEFYERNDLYSHWGYPANLASWISNSDGSPNTAIRMAFWKVPNDDSWHVDVLPIPALSATYLVSFSQGSWSQDASITDSPLLAQFHPLIEMWATQNLLAHAAWWPDDNKDGRDANSNRRKEISLAMQPMLASYEDDFDRFIRTTTDPGLTERWSSFNNGNELGGGWV